MLTMGNILLKFVLTVSSTLFLISTTRFDRLLKGLLQMRIPRIIVMQLSFLYRYLFLLIDEAHRMKTARESRSYGRPTYQLRLQMAGNMIGVLFLKTLERAEKVYAAMVSRGFDGHIPVLTPLRLRLPDYAFVAGTVCITGWLRFGMIW
jgi:cobalt/nickel transport system permease protein